MLERQNSKQTYRAHFREFDPIVGQVWDVRSELGPICLIVTETPKQDAKRIADLLNREEKDGESNNAVPT